MELATQLTAFAALLTSIVTMFTILEMRKQRVVSHLPILKVLGNHVNLVIDKNQNWAWNREKLKIGNFGKGVALDVDVKWEVDINKIISLLQKYDPHNVKELKYENNVLKLDTSTHFVGNQSQKFFPAISVDSITPDEIIIPNYLTTAFESYINEAVLNRPDGSKSLNLDDFPSVDVLIKYQDINQNEYNKKFSLLINIESVSKGGESNDGSASVTFNVHEVSA
ncbi:hypothetical protein [Psychromonas algicola]|uniref:hypothetical protein n=1 Tax=Psychromonas algicola TaxID=2555642 RepID=UPI001068C44B|nr:hypothetical protein [Psychromonas sp. RZ5]TEW42845.1 hypothetical protein E2R67_16300 [Psychromonas sp. RZ5]